MTKVMFVCHGNICRSPMAEFVFKNMVEKKGLEKEFKIASSATSIEEIGNKVHYGTKDKLKEYGISCDGKKSIRFTKEDLEDYDYVVVMDENNMRNIKTIIGSGINPKVRKLLEYVGSNDDIADPWYTGDFDDTYKDICNGCEALLGYIISK